MRLFRDFFNRPLRGRLWLGGFAVAVFLTTIVVGNLCIPSERALTMNMIGHDFTAFYSAGKLVREGHADQLYNIDAVANIERSLGMESQLDTGKGIGPWWNPPFYAWVFVPLAGLPYHDAVRVWMSVNLVAMAGALVLLTRILRAPNPRTGQIPSWRVWGLAPLLIVFSMPFVQGISHGQNTFISLLLLSATITAWRARRGYMAGLLAGLLFYKPQLGAVVAAVMLIDLGPRAAAGAAITGLSLLTINVITLPGTLSAYLAALPANVHFMQIEHAYLWDRHVTIKAFWRLLLQGKAAGEPTFWMTFLSTVSMMVLACGLLAVIAAVWKQKHQTHSIWQKQILTDRLIAAAVVAMPLLMPFYFDYDLLLLSTAAVLLGREMAIHGPRVGNGLSQPLADRWLPRLWMMLFVWLFINPRFAATTRVNITVLLLSGIAGLLIARALRPGSLAAAIDGSDDRFPSLPLTTRHAAAA